MDSFLNSPILIGQYYYNILSKISDQAQLKFNYFKEEAFYILKCYLNKYQ